MIKPLLSSLIPIFLGLGFLVVGTPEIVNAQTTNENSPGEYPSESATPKTPSTTLESKDAPPINKLSEDAKVSEHFAWQGIGGYKGDDGRFQVEVLGTLNRGRFVKKNTVIQKKIKGKWVNIPFEKLKKDFDFEFDFEAPAFAFRMNLTKGEYRIHAVLFIDSETFEYDFEFETSDKWPPLPPPATRVYLCNKCFNFGAGLNYLNYQQTPPDGLDPINYSVFTPLPLSFEARWAINKKNGIRLEYHKQSGPAIESDTITLEKSAVGWSYLTLGADNILKDNGKLLGLSYSNGFLYGLQFHSIPFLNTSDSTTYSIEPFNLISLGAGGFTGIRMEQSELIFLMRLQLALTGQGEVKLKSGLSFDGALSYIRDSGKNYYWGLYWGGQYHSYKYELGSEGTYSLVVSKIEGRWGLRF